MWTVVAVGLLVVGALAMGTWSGTFVDYVAIPGECTVGPALGWPGAVLTAAVCAAGSAVLMASAPGGAQPVEEDGDDAPVVLRS